MKLLQRENGQGLVEYTLIVFLVALVFWVAVKGTDVDKKLETSWQQIGDCLTKPMECKGAK